MRPRARRISTVPCPRPWKNSVATCSTTTRTSRSSRCWRTNSPSWKPGRKPRACHEQDVKQFLVSSQPKVMEEPFTTAWFAIRTENGEYGIFDVFPDNEARLLHLTGAVPRELTKHAFTWIGSMPGLELVSVRAEERRP